MKEVSPIESIAPWPRILVFTIVSTSIAYPFRNNLLDLQGALIFGVPFLQALLEGAGVFLAALIATNCFTEYWRPANYFGDSAIHSVITFLTPIFVFTILGVNNSKGVDPHLFGLVLSASVAIYCLLEETGWRGFLQNATTSIPRTARYLGVGLIWYLWHLSFIGNEISLLEQIKFIAILIGASYLLGSLVEKTNSVLLAASFHFCFDFIAFSQIGGVDETQGKRLLLIAAIVFAWIPILVHWNRDKNHGPSGGL